MHLYQNEISIIKYFNYDDTSKTKDARKYQICFQFLNYYALKIKWNYGCANAHQLIRHSGVIYPERRIILLYKYDKNYSLPTGTNFRLDTFLLQYSAEKTQIQEKDVDKFRAFNRYPLRCK